MVRFGVAGFPPAFVGANPRRNRVEVFEWLSQLGLNAFEIQMTYGPRSSVELCRLYREAAESLDIRLSIHASYYIVLTSSDSTKIKNSIDTLKRTYELADILGAREIILHPGPLYGEEPKACIDRLISNLKLFFSDIGKTEIGLFLETAGKLGQLGSLEEILYITGEVMGAYPCVDFGHVHARTRGGLSDTAQIASLFDRLEESEAFSTGRRIHFHYTPIEYGPRGEIMHRSINDSLGSRSQPGLFSEYEEAMYHPRLEPIIDRLRSYDLDYTIISETHNTQEEGAIAMRNHYHMVR